MLTAMLMKRFRPGLHMACVDAVDRNNGERRTDIRCMMVKGLLVVLVNRLFIVVMFIVMNDVQVKGFTVGAWRGMDVHSGNYPSTYASALEPWPNGAKQLARPVMQ
jgi:hypothetical protein